MPYRSLPHLADDQPKPARAPRWRAGRVAGLAVGLVLAAPIADLVSPHPMPAPAGFGWQVVPHAEARRAKPAVKRAAARAKQRRIEAALEKARQRRKAATAALPAAPIVSLPNPAAATLPTIAEMRAAVLATPAAQLVRVGRHLIVGYHNAAQLTPLLERGAIGGVFVTARNAGGRSKEMLAAEIARFRALAAKGGQSPFWISTDQEGGGVSRLSPPLPRQPSLARVIAELKTPEARQLAVAQFAERQAEALAGIGVDLNFAPVADLNLDARNARDRFTRLRHRAVSADPAVVSEVARTYCEHLARHAIACTLKHFPGIGRVVADTHVTPATLKTPRDVLAAADWVPFRAVLSTTPAFLMVGHPHVAALDREARPASTSSAVIDGIVRKELGFDGVVITDDLAMGAIRRRPGGMPRAAVEALAAGADLVLLGLDGDQIYAVLYAMLAAEKSGEVGRDRWRESAARLRKAAAAAALVAEQRSPVPLGSGDTTSSPPPADAKASLSGKAVGEVKAGSDKSSAGATKTVRQ